MIFPILESRICFDHLSRGARDPVFGSSDQVRHKPVCTVTYESLKLKMFEILDLSIKGIVLSV